MSELAIREHAPAMVRLSSEQLQYIAHTEFVPKSMRGNLPAILACVAMGRELGLGDMVSLRNVHVIDGRTALSAEVMVALVRQRGHSIQGNFSGDSCTVAGKRIDNGDEITVTWTRQMAVDAGLVNKDNYKRYTPAMLWARGVSQLCRMLFEDCFAGSAHTPEEISDGDFEEFDDSAGEPEASGSADVLSPVAVSQAATGEPASPAEAPPTVDSLLDADDLAVIAQENEEETAANEFASEPQRRLIFAKAKEAGVETAALKSILADLTGQESTKAIPRAAVEAILLAIDAAGVSV
jgi:hypothetical protein